MMNIRNIDIERTFCLSGMLNFTRYVFRKKTGNKFIIGEHHRIICDALDKVVKGDIKRLIINIAPRYGKTELAVKNFIAYGLALNPKSKFIHLSYSDDLVLDSSKEINTIVRSDYFQRLFPESVTDSTNAKKWNTNVGGGLYAVIIIDDPIKPEDALSDTIRERVNNRFETTIRNRVNSRNTPIIIIMQRLHEHDLCGYLQEIEPEDWTVISLPCIQHNENGQEKALWEFKHTLEELHKIESANSFVFNTQYMQNPTPIEGLMYRKFQTYDTIPYYKDSEKKNYTDTADTGSDYLCSICYVDTPIGNFVTDVLYTQKPMEYTEPKTAEMITRNATDWVDVESNNGGRGFARNVEKQCREMGNTKTFINWFCQTDNKQVRIFTKSADVNNMTFFPVGWERKWPEFHNAIAKHRKEGSNSHDDAPDALTGCFEKRKIRVKKQYSKEDLGIF